MWDGNDQRRSGVLPVDDELSENQCGMETFSRQRMPARPSWVEREPMWDGNIQIPPFVIEQIRG